MHYNFHSDQLLRTPIKPLKTSFTKEELLSLFAETEVKEALFLSSPNLLDEYEKWQQGKFTDKKEEEEEERLVYSLLKYANRMHIRCTPFGLFAGCGVVNSSLQLTKENYTRSTRLDMNFTCALAQELAKLPYIQPYLKFVPNTSTYSLQDKLRYVEYYYKDKVRVHQISAVDNTEYLQAILQKAKNGARVEEMAATLVSEDISLNEALAYVSEIINAQLLVSELEPSVTGKDSLTQIIGVLFILYENTSKIEIKNILIILEEIQVELIAIDSKIGNNISVYQKIKEQIEQLNIPFELNKLFQTDLFISANSVKKESENSFFATTRSQLTSALKVLNKLTPTPKKTTLTQFKDKFYERYEDAEIPLSEALDSETGIGYAQNNNHSGSVTPLVQDLLLLSEEETETEIQWHKIHSFLFKKLLSANNNKQYIITISNKELKDFDENWSDLPDSFSVMYSHHGKREEKEVLSISNAGGTSATFLLGRFALGNQEIEQLVNEIANKEKELNPTVVLAEIVHLPESRTGNILMRPIFRDFEIPYLSNSSLPKENQIELDDLYLSVNNEQFYLRSKRLNKQVLPYLGNAHNYSFNALPVYHFLCELQTQNKRSGLYFDWGQLKDEFSFLPRVEVDGVILSYALWQLKKEDYQNLVKKEANIFKEIKRLQDKWNLPKLVLLVEGDNELLINLGDKLSCEMFVSVIKKQPEIILKEFLFDEKTALVKDKNGDAYTNEFITILQKNIPLKEELSNEQYDENRPVLTQDLTRNFSLGSEWLYYKIYSGAKTADKILTEVIKPLTEHLIKEKLIDNWFFIRYTDPELHLRLRFHFVDTQNISSVISMFQEAISDYEQNGVVWKIQTDTYKREVERYGENTILLGEQLFYYDSKCIVDMLDMIDGDEGEEIRWQFCLRMVDELLSTFEYALEQKKELMEMLKTGFASEFNMKKELKMQVDKKFRNHRKTISELLNKNNDATSEMNPLFELLNQKSIKSKKAVVQILEIHKNKELKLKLNDLLASYIHMLLNRLFSSKQRLHEMVIYDFLWRTYRSQIAIQKQTNDLT